MRLTSWVKKGLDWASSDEVSALQTRIKSMVDKNIKLVNVIQVMLFRRILPCQSRTCNLWEFDPASPRTLQRFFGTTHEDIWKLLFKAQKSWPKTTEDLGLECTHSATPVSFLITLICRSKEYTELSILPTGLDEEAERIRCPAPLPEDPAIPLLTRMLVPAPYQAPEKKAKKIIATAIQRYAGDYVAERTVSVVPLPNDEMKGRIIGREGRNIRALEAATGIDLIIDDTPEAVILSGFNPVRREVARISLTRLISDGRIHPARIEDVVKKAAQEVEQAIKEAGEQAAFDLGLHGLHPDLIKIIGRLKFRTSYSQNVLQHSLEVAFLSGIMASELGLNTKLARRMGLLHDIGKAIDHEVEGPHAIIGSKLAKKYGENAKVVHSIAAHHEDVPPASVYAFLIQSADGLSGARPGARKELLENYIKRLEDLEKIANEFKGVANTYAIQAGRELRVIVESDKVTDDEAFLMSKDIARKIGESMNFPGQIKVTVIRETRAVELANSN